jgi:hypothetical protein
VSSLWRCRGHHQLWRVGRADGDARSVSGTKRSRTLMLVKVEYVVLRFGGAQRGVADLYCSSMRERTSISLLPALLLSSLLLLLLLDLLLLLGLLLCGAIAVAIGSGGGGWCCCSHTVCTTPNNSWEQHWRTRQQCTRPQSRK